jgi:predicted site-specific integrase-resolvase
MNTELHSRKLYFVNDVADKCGVSSQTIKRWAKAGKIPAPDKLKANGRLVFTEEALRTAVEFATATEGPLNA